ncbi:MAG: hypothetical protein ACFFEO_03090 [Candidatus Thorarchaeota archaeon]
MKNSKYKRALLFFLVYCLFWIGISIALSLIIGRSDDLTKLIPISDMGLETALLSILLLPISSLLGLFVGGYAISPLFLYIHKKIFKSKMEYGIYDRPEFPKFKYFSSGLFSALMAINFSLFLLTPEIVTFSRGNIPTSQADYATTFVVLLVITFFLATILFATTWFLSDSGILYSNKNALDKTPNPPEVRSIGRWYGQFLKGYAGVSVVFSYFEFITIFLVETASLTSLFSILLAIFIPFPFFMVLPFIPTLIVSDLLKNHRTEYIRRYASKLGIIKSVEITFELRD